MTTHFSYQCKEYQQLHVYSTGRIFKHSPREIYLEAQDSKSAHMRKGAGEAHTLKQGSKMNICTLSGQTYAPAGNLNNSDCQSFPGRAIGNIISR